MIKIIKNAEREERQLKELAKLQNEEKQRHQQIVNKITHHINKVKKLYNKKQSTEGKVPEKLKEKVKRRIRKIHTYVASLKGRKIHSEMKSFTKSVLKELHEDYMKHKDQKKKATAVVKHPKEHIHKISIGKKLAKVGNNLKNHIDEYKLIMNSKAEAKSAKDRKEIKEMLKNRHKNIIAAVQKIKKLKKLIITVN